MRVLVNYSDGSQKVELDDGKVVTLSRAYSDGSRKIYDGGTEIGRLSGEYIDGSKIANFNDGSEYRTAERNFMFAGKQEVWDKIKQGGMDSLSSSEQEDAESLIRETNRQISDEIRRQEEIAQTEYYQRQQLEQQQIEEQMYYEEINGIADHGLGYYDDWRDEDEEEEDNGDYWYEDEEDDEDEEMESLTEEEVKEVEQETSEERLLLDKKISLESELAQLNDEITSISKEIDNHHRQAQNFYKWCWNAEREYRRTNKVSALNTARSCHDHYIKESEIEGEWRNKLADSLSRKETLIESIREIVSTLELKKKERKAISESIESIKNKEEEEKQKLMKIIDDVKRLEYQIRMQAAIKSLNDLALFGFQDILPLISSPSNNMEVYNLFFDRDEFEILGGEDNESFPNSGTLDNPDICNDDEWPEWISEVFSWQINRAKLILVPVVRELNDSWKLSAIYNLLDSKEVSIPANIEVRFELVLQLTEYTWIWVPSRFSNYFGSIVNDWISFFGDYREFVNKWNAIVAHEKRD